MILLRSGVKAIAVGMRDLTIYFPALCHPLCLLTMVGLDTSLSGSRWMTQPLSDLRLGSIRPSGKRGSKWRWVINSLI